MRTHRHITKRRTIFWQVGALGIVGAAVAVAVMPYAGNWFKLSAAKPPTPVAPVPPVDNSAIRNLDLATAVKGSEAIAAPAPPPPPKVEVAVAPLPDPPPPAPPVQAGPDWAYIGSIITPTKRSALVKINGEQAILPLNAERDDAKLVTIEKDHIEIAFHGEKKKVDLTPRSQLAPSEPPKRQVSFRTPPVINTPGANPAFAAGRSGMFPPVTQPGQPMPATFDQARMAALAAREAARRNPPPVEPPQQHTAEMSDEMIKHLAEPNVPNEERMKIFQNMGISPGDSVDEAMSKLKAAGLDPNTAAFKANLRALEMNAKKDQEQ